MLYIFVYISIYSYLHTYEQIFLLDLFQMATAGKVKKRIAQQRIIKAKNASTIKNRKHNKSQDEKNKKGLV